MKIIKSLLFAIALIIGVGTTSAYADEGTHGIGVNFGYAVGSKDMSNFGLGIRYNYQLSDNIRIEPSFMYYFDSDKFAEKEINMNLHYLFNTANDRFHAYPIFGVTTIFGAEREQGEKGDKDYKEKDSFFRFGVNLGAGLQYDCTDDFALVVEARYKLVKTFDNFGLLVGCVMTF